MVRMGLLRRGEVLVWLREFLRAPGGFTVEEEADGFVLRLGDGS